jgi:ATP-dependent Lhr-like helicase
VLSSRVVDYSPAYLDELTASGEVLWAGHGQIPGTDGWVSLHLADSAPLTLPEHGTLDATPLHYDVLSALEGGGAYFFRQLSDAVGSSDDKTLAAALWDLVWAGRLTNDTIGPLRALTRGSHTAHRSRRPPPRARLGRPTGRADLPTRSGPSTTPGRWSLLPALESDPTRRAHATAESLLERHGVVTRGAVASERVPGGFAAVYKVLSTFEDSGRCRRGYFIGTLGAAQFGITGAVDRLRTFSRDLTASPDGKISAVALASTDPANPYGAALPWPDRGEEGHRPGRKAGALVVLIDGELVVYVERGGRTLLTYSEDAETLTAAAGALATAVKQGALGRLTVEKADGSSVLGRPDTPLRQAFESAGFVATPRGLRLRA